MKRHQDGQKFTDLDLEFDIGREGILGEPTVSRKHPS
jgi:hypothetical protein